MAHPDGLTPAQQELPAVIVQAALENATREFENLDTRRWAGWVAYLLETLESRRPDEIESVLQDVRDAIETRLDIGRW